MTDREPRDLLSEAFADLPRQRPTADFTGKVLAELDRSDRRGQPVQPWAWAAAATLLLICLIAVGYGFQRQQAAERAYRAQVEELRGRYLELLDEVASVREEAATPATRLYLGGDERVDLVLDWANSPALGEMSDDPREVRPASYEP